MPTSSSTQPGNFEKGGSSATTLIHVQKYSRTSQSLLLICKQAHCSRGHFLDTKNELSVPPTEKHRQSESLINGYKLGVLGEQNRTK
jgi:hypothetical protein